MLNITETNATSVNHSSTALPYVDEPEMEHDDRQNLSYLIVPFCSLLVIGILTIAKNIDAENSKYPNRCSISYHAKKTTGRTIDSLYNRRSFTVKLFCVQGRCGDADE
ncbi:unnamed protein product [Nesidiocoris tenuis]|uniref:Uncharacterized protein n=1 Tax=Nesidiocoris tenuis TaxID=355587 RepID=A0A6H5HVF7_9HEMI|nr:unnamed protein product [Nesidiocoris tenuis]